MKFDAEWIGSRPLIFLPAGLLSFPYGGGLDPSLVHTYGALRQTALYGYLGLCGIALLLQRRSEAKTMAAPRALAPEESVGVSYGIDREIMRRMDLYTLFDPRFDLFSVCLLAGIFGLMLSVGICPLTGLAHVVVYLFLLIGGFFTWWVGFIVLKSLKHRQLYPRPDSVRPCTSRLTRNGFFAERVDKTTLLPWSDIARVVEHEGDIYVRSREGRTWFVPRTAFATPDEGRAFFVSLRSLWHSKGTKWEEVFGAPRCARR